MSPRLFDCFMFSGDGGGELDMLECRLRAFEDTPVWRHVLVEATVSHRGPLKPLYYLDNRDRYAAWHDRILHVVVKDLPSGPSPWDRVNVQRECIGTALQGIGADPDDVVIMSDLDEIITPEGVRVALRGEHVCFQQLHALFYVDWMAPRRWPGPSAARLRDVDSFAAFRLTGSPVTEGAGWHLSWLGEADGVRAKMARYGHSEMDAQMFQGLEDGSFLDRGDTWEGQCVPIDFSGEWPGWVRDRECPPGWFRPRQRERAAV